KEFAENNYTNYVYVNFEMDKELLPFFDNEIKPQKILKTLERHYKIKINKADTCIIFDEIQYCESALTSLKYFAELEPDFHIIAAGSLLGIELNRVKSSFPVGKVRLHEMHTMDFQEFLIAIGEDLMLEKIKNCYMENSTMPEILHNKILDIYHQYLIVGGMPAVINKYIEKDDDNISGVKLDIVNSYIADMTKYTEHPLSSRIRTAYNSIPAQLSKENRKFQYKVIKKGARASLFGDSIDWLVNAGIVNKCEKITHGFLPLSVYKDLSSFKLYFNDTGLFASLTNVSFSDLVRSSFMQFKGAFIENYVAVQLVASGYDLVYWESEGRAEIDFIIKTEQGIVPIEVKSSSNVRSRSLSVFRNKYNPEICYRISEKNFGFENGIKSIPLYAVFMI
ncbi:MAG: ATP-binding protein, partial [Clostridiales bacterium]|nr:ATP-binding protein [Clostridiales bacterium]